MLALTIISDLSLSLVSITHCVTREVIRIEARLKRIVCPFFEIRSTSDDFFSSSERIFAETSFPVFGVTAIAFTPDPHLF